jgi:hypothetical protein
MLNIYLNFFEVPQKKKLAATGAHVLESIIVTSAASAHAHVCQIIN